MLQISNNTLLRSIIIADLPNCDDFQPDRPNPAQTPLPALSRASALHRYPNPINKELKERPPE
jgi:hypothetical protein